MLSQHRLIRTPFLLGFAAFILIGIFGMSHLGMDMNADGYMSDCPFMFSASLCTMTPFEHISAFKGILNALPRQQNASTLALLLSAATVLILFSWKSFLSSRIFSAQRFRPYRNSLPSSHPLQEAFSNGILHPKYY